MKFVVGRAVTVHGVEEILPTLLLYSYLEDVPTYELSDFFVLSNALTSPVWSWVGATHIPDDFWLHFKDVYDPIYP